jgi:hypothetical protein
LRNLQQSEPARLLKKAPGQLPGWLNETWWNLSGDVRHRFAAESFYQFVTQVQMSDSLRPLRDRKRTIEHNKKRARLVIFGSPKKVWPIRRQLKNDRSNAIKRSSCKKVLSQFQLGFIVRQRMIPSWIHSYLASDLIVKSFQARVLLFNYVKISYIWQAKFFL